MITYIYSPSVHRHLFIFVSLLRLIFLIEMSDTLFWIFLSVVIIEATLICLGNAFTIFVFWHQRASLKKTCHLLVNLAIADLLVGASTLVRVASKKIPKHQPLFIGDIFSVFFCLFATVSVLCLMVISLERAYAVLWPFRHRVSRTRTYISGIVLAWIGGLSSAILDFLLIHGTVSFTSALSTIIGLLFTSLFVMLAAYMTVRKRMNSPHPLLEGENRKTVEQNVKLSKTLFVVIGLSFSLWLPTIIMYTILAFCLKCASLYLIWFVTILSLANSVVNPFVYCYKMPAFKAAIKRLFRKNRVH